VLKPGLVSDELHTCHEYTWGALLKAVRNAHACDCPECQEDKARAKKTRRAEEIRREMDGKCGALFMDGNYPGTCHLPVGHTGSHRKEGS
jgi:hypothetical protein